MATTAEQHKATALQIVGLILEHTQAEAERWTLLESLCLAVGVLHGRNNRATAIFVETMAERIATGARD